jgi:MYND finger
MYLRYVLLSESLLLCANFESAHDFCLRGLKKFPRNKYLLRIKSTIELEAPHFLKNEKIKPEEYIDKGFVRREIYPWNAHEPNRCSDATIAALNSMLGVSAPDLEVRIVDLPDLRPTEPAGSPIRQLGLFAKKDLPPGAPILTETSFLTATSITDPFCDACSVALIPSAMKPVTCTECAEIIFCSPTCRDRAWTEYHSAICDTETASIGKDVPAPEASAALYTLLLFRTFAMSLAQNVHPLSLPAIKYIWGDFTTTGSEPTLPFTFRYNILLPLNYLEIVLATQHSSLNIFTLPWCDVWVFNTLLAKFRGTASAKQDARGRPEVGAVHPLWGLANHSCAPNVRWDWEGSMRFWVRERPVEWAGNTKESGGIKAGEEILSHYCDVELGVKDRREWAAGALGGECMCERCVWESNVDEIGEDMEVGDKARS